MFEQQLDYIKTHILYYYYKCVDVLHQIFEKDNVKYTYENLQGDLDARKL